MDIPTHLMKSTGIICSTRLPNPLIPRTIETIGYKHPPKNRLDFEDSSRFFSDGYDTEYFSRINISHEYDTERRCLVIWRHRPSISRVISYFTLLWVLRLREPRLWALLRELQLWVPRLPEPRRKRRLSSSANDVWSSLS